MKKILIALASAAAVLTGCATSESTGLNDNAKRYFDAWMSLNYPDAKKTTNGAYVISSTQGDGIMANECDTYPYVRLDYSVQALDGTYQSYCSPDIAKQLGEYAAANYYGPQNLYRGSNSLYAGLEEVLPTLREGGEVKMVIPGWLITTNRYDNEEGYLENESGDDAIYNLKLIECISDMNQWEIDSISRYLSHNFPQVDPADTVAADDNYKHYGYYFITTQEPTDTCHFRSDTTFYINYTGKLLNGQVFDTTIKDTAKVYNIYDSSNTYEPTIVNCGESYSDFTIGSDGNSVITGFAYALYQLRTYEKCTVIFYSPLGYSYSGSGDTIPGYSPLRFDIEVVDAPED